MLEPPTEGLPCSHGGAAPTLGWGGLASAETLTPARRPCPGGGSLRTGRAGLPPAADFLGKLFSLQLPVALGGALPMCSRPAAGARGWRARCRAAIST